MAIGLPFNNVLDMGRNFAPRATLVGSVSRQVSCGHEPVLYRAPQRLPPVPRAARDAGDGGCYSRARQVPREVV